MKTCGAIVGMAFLGGIVGFALGCAWLAGWFNFWLPVQNLPGRAVQILDASLYEVAVQTQDHQVYTCDINSGTCALEYRPFQIEHQSQCRMNAAIIKSSPAYFEVCVDTPLIGENTQYSLRSDGHVYHWHSHSEELTPLGVIFFTIFGALGGYDRGGFPSKKGAKPSGDPG